MSAATLTTKEQPEAGRLQTAADVARPNRCHPNTVKKIAAELRLVLIRTQSGCRLFTPDQSAAIAREIERRRREAYR